MIPDWLQRHAWWLLMLSAALGLAAALAAARFLMNIPSDYFLTEQRPAETDSAVPWARRAVLLGKNITGIGLIAVGAVMSLPLVPGPGLIVVLIGLSLTNFPGKRKWELRLMRSPMILRPLNWLRTKTGRTKLQMPFSQ